ncbi:MAG: hypothetical protein V4648_06465 [Bacteroidota bacterium]
MKIKLLLTALILASFQNFYAQESALQPTVDSLKTNTVNTEKELIEKQNKEIKEKSERLEKDAEKLAKEQKKFEKEQKRIMAAEKSVSKSQSKLIKEQKQLEKMQQKLSRKRNNYSPVEIEEANVRIAKQQLYLKEIEEDIASSQKKLNKVRS